MQKYLLICILICLSVYTDAQVVIKTAQGVRFSTEKELVEVSFYTPTLVRVLKSPLGVDCIKKSLSVVAIPQTVKYEIYQNENNLKLTTGKLKITISLKSGQI